MTLTVRQLALSEIPVIGIGGLGRGGAGTTVVIAEAIRRASEQVGFFYVKDHGIPPALRERALAQAKHFFALPDAAKREVQVNRRHRGYIPVGDARMYGKGRPDLKESFKWGLELPASDPEVMAGRPLMGPNQWPATPPGLRGALYDWFTSVMACGDRILGAIAVSLGLQEDFFAASYRKPLSRGGIIHYPAQDPQSPADQYGVAPHSDYGCLTLLWQDDTGGLQVKGRAGDWIAATPIEDSFVINIGDLLARWSNERFVSTPHRVVNASDRDRYSMVVFHDPHGDTVVDPRDMALPPGMAPLHAPIRVSDYIAGRFAEAFTYKS